MRNPLIGAVTGLLIASPAFAITDCQRTLIEVLDGGSTFIELMGNPLLEEKKRIPFSTRIILDGDVGAVLPVINQEYERHVIVDPITRKSFSWNIRVWPTSPENLVKWGPLWEETKGWVYVIAWSHANECIREPDHPRATEVLEFNFAIKSDGSIIPAPPLKPAVVAKEESTG